MKGTAQAEPGVPARRVSSIDGALVLGALALAGSSLQLTTRWFSPAYLQVRAGQRPLRLVRLLLENAWSHGTPLLVITALLVVALSVTHGRGRQHVLRRQPGFVLSFTIALGALGTVAVLGWEVPLSRRGTAGPLIDVIQSIIPNVGSMILGAWLVLALNGRGCPGQDRLDRLGYGLACVWSCLFVVFWVQ